MSATKDCKIIQKAFIVWHPDMISDNPYEGFSHVDEISSVYAKTPGQAKTGQSEARNWMGEDFDFRELRVKRHPQDDLIVYNYKVAKRGDVEYRIESEKWKKERLAYLQGLPDGDYFVQAAGKGYVGNSVLFWGKDHCGYVIGIDRAGVYPKNEMIEICKNSEEEIPWPADYIHQKKTFHVDMQHIDKEEAFK